MKKITYKKSGVDLASAALLKKQIAGLAKKSFRQEVLKGIGGFGSFFRFAHGAYKDPVLVSSADGVGTKLKIASLVSAHDTVGIDAVAMNVNDILCTGAQPLFFLDYIAYSHVPAQVLVEVVKGLTAGCIESGCSLIGGETAQMPGMYGDGEYDLAGFCVGAVERAGIIDGSKIEAGDTLIGLESSGLHSNGYSLVRKVFSENELRRMSKVLLAPTRIYVRPVLSLLSAIKGISHITGGAFYDKVSRILPDNVDARIRKNAWVVPQIFRLVQNKGGIAEHEMYHTLNMGIGMVLVVSPSAAAMVVRELIAMKIKSWVIGEIVRGRGNVEIV